MAEKQYRHTCTSKTYPQLFLNCELLILKEENNITLTTNTTTFIRPSISLDYCYKHGKT